MLTKCQKFCSLFILPRFHHQRTLLRYFLNGPSVFSSITSSSRKVVFFTPDVKVDEDCSIAIAALTKRNCGIWKGKVGNFVEPSKSDPSLMKSQTISSKA